MVFKHVQWRLTPISNFNSQKLLRVVLFQILPEDPQRRPRGRQDQGAHSHRRRPHCQGEGPLLALHSEAGVLQGRGAEEVVRAAGVRPVQVRESISCFELKMYLDGNDILKGFLPDLQFSYLIFTCLGQFSHEIGTSGLKNVHEICKSRKDLTF